MIYVIQHIHNFYLHDIKHHTYNDIFINANRNHLTSYMYIMDYIIALSTR